MKIAYKHLVVKNGLGVYVSPEFVYVKPVGISDGIWVIDGTERIADNPEANVIKQQFLSQTPYGTIETVIKQIINNIDKIMLAPVSLPKITKAGAVAIEMHMLTLGREENKWSIVGIGVNSDVIDLVEENELYAQVINVSSGIIQPLFGETHHLGIVKEYLVFKSDEGEIFICAQGKKNV